MNVLEMENMDGNDREFFNFFKQLKIEDVNKLIVAPQRTTTYFYTHFCFETKDENVVVFHYDQNKKVNNMYLMKEHKYLFLNNSNTHKNWMTYIWEQLVERFNLRVRLMFLNEHTPWSWDLKYVK